MKREYVELILRGCGLVHFSILVASAMVPRVLDWRTHLAPLHPFLRRLLWVYGVFIVMTNLEMSLRAAAFVLIFSTAKLVEVVALKDNTAVTLDAALTAAKAMIG